MEFDHLFICVSKNAPEADLLIEAGFTEGSSNRHPGQGTANRRFFFDNAFIELLYAQDAEELQSSLTEPVRLYERLSRSDLLISPFGLCFRPSMAEKITTQVEPFPCWHYQPEYLPAHLHVDIATAPLTEPMWFYLSFGSRPDKAEPARQENRRHQNGVTEITAVRVTGSQAADLSDAALAICQNNKGPSIAIEGKSSAQVAKEPEHLIEIEFDNYQQKKSRDFRPRLPLICRW